MTSLLEPGRSFVRRRYIDWARGLAVLIMIGAHVLDAWTGKAGRASIAYGKLMLLGGFAAPLFLWLAGVGLVLSAERTVAATGSRSRATETVVRRGLEIFIFAFLFRIQAFIVSPGSWPVTIFRVDILNVMGPAIAVAGVLWGLSFGTRRALLLCAVVAAASAMAAPVIRVAGWVDALPLWFQWYLRPSGDHTTFTLFPWIGFVFAGASCGAALALATARQAEQWAVTILALSGALLAGAGLYAASLPTIYRASSFWTSSPTYFMIRVGIMLLALGLLYSAVPLATRWSPPFEILETLGRNSLFIYWIHVELVYGYATWGIHRKLPLWAVGGAYLIFCAVMYCSIGLRDRIVRSGQVGTPQKSAREAIPT